MGLIVYLCRRNSKLGRDMFQAGVELYNYMDTFFCCTVTSSKEFESVITEHMLVYVISGELDVISKERRRHLQRGQAYLIRRNCRAHKIEYPSKDGTPFKGLQSLTDANQLAQNRSLRCGQGGYAPRIRLVEFVVRGVFHGFWTCQRLFYGLGVVLVPLRLNRGF